MTDTDEEVRKAYMDWLRGGVEKHCRDDGTYEVFWDYDDRVTPDQMRAAWAGYGKRGYESPKGYLEELVFDNVRPEDTFYSYCILADLGHAPDEVREGHDLSESIWDDLEEAGYRGVDLNLDDLLARSSFEVNLMFATPAEMNLDMGSMVDAFGNDYLKPGENLTGEDLDNGLSYLVNQQGHSVSEMYGELVGYEPTHSSLVRSACDEMRENTSEARSELCCLLRVDGDSLFELMSAVDEAAKSIVLPIHDATLGVFNQWSGCGGMLDIQLERDAELPLSMVYDLQIEGQSGTNQVGSYTVREVYGNGGEDWKRGFKLQDAPVLDVREDYERALAAAAEKRVVPLAPRIREVTADPDVAAAAKGPRV